MTDKHHREGEQQQPDWVPYTPGADYAGAAGVVEQELEYIKLRRGVKSDPKDLTGIALSGGGIRSASYALGILQALANKGRLSEIDYLSTVSGGGYIGSSLTWLLHREWVGTDGKAVRFGLDAGNFPYGTYPIWGRDGPEAPLPADAPEELGRTVKGSMLRFLRQHARYLTPGHGITLGSLVAVVLRGSLLSLLVYLPLLVLAFLPPRHFGFFGDAWLPFGLGTWFDNTPLALAAASFLVFVACAVVYSLAAFKLRWYPGRRFFEQWAKWLLYFALAMAVLGVLPLVHAALPSMREALFGEGAGEGGWFGTIIGGLSSLLGVLSGIAAFLKSGEKEKGRVPLGLLVGVATVFLLFGLLLLAYELAVPWCSWLERTPGAWWSVGAVGVWVLALGGLTNLNYVSVHRYYRDRLMESFLPDVEEVLRSEGSKPGASTEADRTRLHDMCTPHDGEPHADHFWSPYHIVNANVVLVESIKPKFQGRGGDNFILSPRFCGSNATGWRDTRHYMGGEMTLATAMAISGAAVNPSAGCGGEGVTRQPLLSMLMGLLNIRLGYWGPNPDPECQPRWFRTANFLCPGLWELVLRKRLNENSRFLQLSDGGHFENLGLYELVRRRLKLIILCDGAADADFGFGDLANAIEKVRVDFGAHIHIDSEDLQALIPRYQEDEKDNLYAVSYAERGYLVAPIHYADGTKGTLLYFKTTFSRDLSADLYGYKQAHPEFPDESTADQFFDEKQFEAYRELGYQTAWNMLSAYEQPEDWRVFVIGVGLEATD